MQLKRTSLRQRNAGFTIVELMVATVIFGTIMLVVAVGVLRFTHDYYKGLVSANTQAVTRSIMADVTQSLQFSAKGAFWATDDTDASDVALNEADGGFCMGSVQYSYAIGRQVTPTGSLGAHQSRHGLIKRLGVKTCTTDTKTDDVYNTNALTTGQRELLGDHMRIAAFDITPVGDTTYQVHIRVIYGDDDLLSPAIDDSTDYSKENCSGIAGSQWCAVSDLTTVVDKRL